MAQDLDPQINASVIRLKKSIASVGTIVPLAITLLEYAMATQADLQAEIASLKDAIEQDQINDQAVVDTLVAQVEALKAGSDTAEVIAQLESLKGLIKPVVATPSGETPVG